MGVSRGSTVLGTQFKEVGEVDGQILLQNRISYKGDLLTLWKITHSLRGETTDRTENETKDGEGP